MADDAVYEGRSGFLRWWPKILIVASWWVLSDGWPESIPWAAFLIVLAYLFGRWIPYRFLVHDEGLVLVFPFGRRVYLPKEALTVRLEAVGAIAMLRGRRFGYLLNDGLLYDPQRGPKLSAALHSQGYRVA